MFTQHMQHVTGLKVYLPFIVCVWHTDLISGFSFLFILIQFNLKKREANELWSKESANKIIRHLSSRWSRIEELFSRTYQFSNLNRLLLILELSNDNNPKNNNDELDQFFSFLSLIVSKW